MKKITIIALFLQLFLVLKIDIVGAAAWEPPKSPTQNHQLTFLRVRDEYQLMYALGGLPAGTTHVRANFWSTTDTYYSTVFENPTKIAYLTCNGTYIFEMLNGSGTTIGETRQIKTTKIEHPACKSYENSGLKNEINATGEVRSDGKGVNINWDKVAGATKYQVFFNGENVGEFTSNSTVQFHGKPNGTYSGTYTVAAIDSDGKTISSGDFIIDDPRGGEIGGGDGSGGDGGDGSGGDGDGDGSGDTACGDGCEWIKSALACPEWDTYMGELTQAIKDALPPPTDWDDVANTFVNHFDNYFGDVPAPPTKDQIESNVTPPMPSIDTSVPEASMSPSVPNDFNNGPLDTDITSGEQIEIIDESEAFEIYEPDKYINSDPVGEMVFPNDPRNSSDGIDNPKTIDTGYAQPTPQPQATSDIPAVDLPMPQPSSDIPVVELPMPTTSISTMPTPQPNDWIIPIPKGAQTD